MNVLRKVLMIIIILLTKHSVLKAQLQREDLNELVEKEEELRLLSMSDNGNWLAWQSVYESRPPDLKISSVANSNPIFIESGARLWQFVRENDIIYMVGNNAKYRNLSKRKEVNFSDVKSAGYLKHLDLLYIHHNDKSDNRLDFYNKHMSLVQSFSDVRRVTEIQSDLMIIRQNGTEDQVVQYDGKKGTTIFRSPSEIYSVSSSGMRSGGWLVYVQAEMGFTMFNVDSDFLVREFSVAGKNQFDGIQQSASSEIDAVLLTLESKKVKKKELVDIWYGKDFNLEDHFRDEKVIRRVLWYPDENRVVETDHKDYSAIAALGKSGLFLRSAIDHEQVDKNDKTAIETVEKYFLYDPKTGETIAFADTSKSFIIDSLGTFILYRDDNEGWVCYNTTDRKRGSGLSIPSDGVPYFISAEDVVWVLGHELWTQSLKTSKKKLIASFVGNDLEILNAKKNKSLMEYNIINQSIGDFDNIVIKLNNNILNTSSMVLLRKGTSKVIVDQTEDRISDFVFNRSFKKYSWFAENYNRSPQIKVGIHTGISKLIYSSAGDPTSTKITMQKLKYKGVKGEDLSAILYFPPSYSQYKKYPVAVSIYEIQQKNSNRYLKPTYKNSRGFNERLFLELGYMVLLPDINNDGSQGPGVTALRNVNAALDELAKIKQTDMKRVGLVGQSYGGYETNFIATQSDRFAAYISGASISDIINTSFAFNYNFFSADYYRYEDGQFKLGKFTEDKDRYYRNNPLYYADQVKSPVLLWTGTGDKNVNPEQTRSFYNALRKYGKSVVALFYKDEQHSLMGYEQRKDLTIRMVEWFDYFLRCKKDFRWIDQQMINRCDSN